MGLCEALPNIFTNDAFEITPIFPIYTLVISFAILYNLKMKSKWFHLLVKCDLILYRVLYLIDILEKSGYVNTK